MSMNSEYLQLGGMFIIAYSLIELVKFIINKYTAKAPFNGTSKAILTELQTQNQNHLHEISIQISEMCNNINLGNDKVVDAIKTMHTDLASRLGEIKGVLSQRR